MWEPLRAAAHDAWAVLAPVECAGCGAPDRSVCAACRAELEAAPVAREALHRRDPEGGEGGGGELPLWTALEYAGAARGILLAFKDAGRTDAVPALAAVLRRLVRRALADVPPEARGRVELVAVPSTRAAFRRRGYRHVPLLLSRAGYRDAGGLRATRETQDQSDLDTTARFANRAESLTVRASVTPRFVLIVDDIATTGATVLEADRAFRRAGHAVLGAVALARTPRRLPELENRAEIDRNCS